MDHQSFQSFDTSVSLPVYRRLHKELYDVDFHTARRCWSDKPSRRRSYFKIQFKFTERSAGFEGVDVYWKQLENVIYGGRRPAAGA